MWSKISKHFQNLPAQEKVAKFLLKHGLSVKNNSISCEGIRIPDVQLATHLGIDRRVVTSIVKTISQNSELSKIFSNLHSVSFLKDMAPSAGWGVVEIYVDDPSQPGIISKVSSLIAREGISIRQAISDDPDLTDDPHLTIITEQSIPSTLLPQIRAIQGIRQINIS